MGEFCQALCQFLLLADLFRKIAQHLGYRRREFCHGCAGLFDCRLELLGDVLDLLLQVRQVFRHLLGLAVLVVLCRCLLTLVHLVFERARLRRVRCLLGLLLRLLRVLDALQVLRQIFQLRLGHVPGGGVLLRLARLRLALGLFHLGERRREIVGIFTGL